MADEAQGGEADGGCHLAYLAVFALVDLDLNPRGGDVGAVSDRWGAFPRWGVVCGEESGLGRARGKHLALGFELHRALYGTEVFGGGGAFDLHMVGLPDFTSAVAFEDAALQRVVVGQQKQAFRVPVKATDGIDIFGEFAQFRKAWVASF